MSVDRITYVDSSAIIKLVVRERESGALRRFLLRRTLVSSALARTEVARALLSLGPVAAERCRAVLSLFELVRINDRVLTDAGALMPAEVRSLDAIHLATALLFGETLQSIVTYDARMAAAADRLGVRVLAPA